MGHMIKNISYQAENSVVPDQTAHARSLIRNYTVRNSLTELSRVYVSCDHSCAICDARYMLYAALQSYTCRTSQNALFTQVLNFYVMKADTSSNINHIIHQVCHTVHTDTKKSLPPYVSFLHHISGIISENMLEYNNVNKLNSNSSFALEIL